MTPHDRHAARKRQRALNRAIEILKRSPSFPAAQIQILNGTKQLMDSLTGDAKTCGTAARLETVLRLLGIRAAAYLKLVENMESQEAFMATVNEFGSKAWEEYTGYPPEVLQPSAGDKQFHAIQQSVGDWIGKGYKVLIPHAMSPPVALPGPTLPLKKPRHFREPNLELLKNQEATLNRKNSAQAIGVSERTLDRLVADKILIPIGPGFTKRFKNKDLLKYFNKRKADKIDKSGQEKTRN